MPNKKNLKKKSRSYLIHPSNIGEMGQEDDNEL
jgi:hypothetical protein